MKQFNHTKTRKFLMLFAMIVAFGGILSLTSCGDEPVPQSNIALDKHGAVEITYKTVHTETADVLTVTRSVYDDNANLVKTIVSADTLPLLRTIKDTLNTGRTYEDENGDNQEIDTVISHPATYQLYITVK